MHIKKYIFKNLLSFVPDVTTSSIFLPLFFAIVPSTANITHPAIRLVTVSSTLIMIQSLIMWIVNKLKVKVKKIKNRFRFSYKIYVTNIPIDIVGEIAVTRIHNQWTKTNGQWEERLLNSTIPNDWIKKFFKFRCKKKFYSFYCTILKQWDNQ